MENFDDSSIDGIGNLRNFANWDVAELKKALCLERFALYHAFCDAPIGWPEKASKEEILKSNSCRAAHRICAWYMNLDGKKWTPFYRSAYGLNEVPRVRMGLIYEKRCENIFIPLVRLSIQKDGRVLKATKRWCEAVIAYRLRSQQR